jgi:hypothetical protein
MQQAGLTMQAHGQAMLDEGLRNDDQYLVAHGRHWLQDGQALVQGGQWMAMNPTVPGSLVTTPGDLSRQGNWGELVRTSQAMLHDPGSAGGVDLDALRWTGEAMLADGRNMASHGEAMVRDVQTMVEQHGLEGQAADDLRSAAGTMIDMGRNLAANGQKMVDYAAQIERSLGY